MNSNKIINLPTPSINTDAVNMSYLTTFTYRNLAATLEWEISNRYSSAAYYVNYGSEAVLDDETSRNIQTLKDQTLSQLDATKSSNCTIKTPTLCIKADRILGKRYYLIFTGNELLDTKINLNISGLTKYYINVFIVFKNTSFRNTHWVGNALFGHDDSGWDIFSSVRNSGQLVISGTKLYNYVYIGKAFTNETYRHNTKKIGDYQTNVNVSTLNTMNCLSIHWNLPSSDDGSYVFINGKKIGSFTSNQTNGTNKMVFGDIDASKKAGLNGYMAYFNVIKEYKMTEAEIKAMHICLCERYNVTYDTIII